MQNIGITGLILIVLVALILFGPKKLPELGRAFGRTLKAFKEGTRELLEEEAKDSEKGPSAAAADKPADADGAPAKAKPDDKRLPD